MRRLVELHHGTVEARSEGPGKGSEFIVRLPLGQDGAPRVGAAPVPARSSAHVNTAGTDAAAIAPTHVDTQTAPAADDAPAPPVRARAKPRAKGKDAGPKCTDASAAAATATTSLRVLVVDDNRDAGQTLGMLIETLGHQTRLAGDGRAALTLFDAWRPQVVFLDIGLPGIDGYEVAAEIRRRSKSGAPRLVAVTGYGQDRDRAKGRQAGFDADLVKPAAYEAIAQILDSAGARGRSS